MAADIQDWTQAVNVTGGTVTISGIATVTISGTPAVTISGTPAVTVSSGTVSIGNTPSVTITGTPTVVLGGGTASIGSVSAIGSTVTVAGTVSISGTTAISGAVSISSGTVSISGTTSISGAVTVTSGSITVAGTVSIGNTPAVTISGTPSVNIASGTVSITGTPNINIQSQSVTLSTQQGQQTMADLIFPAGTSTQVTAAIPAGTQALMLINGDIASLNTMSVIGHVSQTNYLPIDKAQFGVVLGSKDIMVIPIASVLDTTYDVTATNPTGAAITVRLIALFGVQAVWVQSTSKQPVFGWDVTKPFDFQAFAAPAAGSAAVVVAAASLQGRWMCSLARGSISMNGTAGVVGFRVLDGATQKFSELMGGIATARTTDHAGYVDGAFVGTFNTAMTVDCAAGLASAQEAVSAGLHLVGTR